MAIFVYQKHPDHNLGGENYPHFRNQTDKLNYFKKFIDVTKKLDFEITRVAFDSAIVTIDQSELVVSQKLINLSGIASGIIPETGDFQLEFWGVTGGNYGANKNNISLQLTLDYGLTYGPLSFNKAFVRIGRKHMNRFIKDASGKFKVNFFRENRQLQIEEQHQPHALFNSNKAEYYSDGAPTLKFKNTNIVLMMGIVVTAKGSYISKKYKNITTLLGLNTPGFQNGWLIFAKATNKNLNRGLSFSNITHTFYFFLPGNSLKIYNPKVKFRNETTTAPFDHRGTYGLAEKVTFNFKNFLCATKVEVDKIIEYDFYSARGYQEIVKMMTVLTVISASLTNNTFQQIHLDILKVNHNFEIELATLDKLILNEGQLIPFKSFFKNGKLLLKTSVGGIEQYRYNYQNIYFTTINAFNKAIGDKFEIKQNLDKIFKKNQITKNEPYRYMRQLKIFTFFKTYLGFLNYIQEIKLNLFGAYEFSPLAFTYNGYVGINNSYFVIEPDDDSFQLLNKKYNFVASNISKFSNYTDQSIQFYQQQGISFETGINQSKYQINGIKRYQQFSYEQFLYQQTSNIGNYFQNKIGNVAQGILGALSGGNVGGASGGLGFLGLPGLIATPFINNALATKSFDLQQELARKNALYNLKSMLARQKDILNNPLTTHNDDNNELKYLMISTKPLPYLMVVRPLETEIKINALLFHKNGNANDTLQKINFNSNETRRCGNFGEIHNIEQAIVKDKLNSMAINYFNKLFNDGIRLGNVFYDEVKFNDYSLENGEQNVLENEN